MSELQRYDVVVNGVLTTLKLSVEDARRFGALPAEEADPPVSLTRPPTVRVRLRGGSWWRPEHADLPAAVASHWDERNWRPA